MKDPCLAMKIIDMEKLFPGKFPAVWRRDMCLAYAVYKRAYNVADTILGRYPHLKRTLARGFGEHYGTHILSIMAGCADIVGFKWLMGWTKVNNS